MKYGIWEGATHPDGLCGTSASDALAGPRDQALRDLVYIIRECRGWDTAEAVTLADEALAFWDEIQSMSEREFAVWRDQE